MMETLWEAITKILNHLHHTLEEIILMIVIASVAVASRAISLQVLIIPISNRETDNKIRTIDETITTTLHAAAVNEGQTTVTRPYLIVTESAVLHRYGHIEM